MQKRIWFLSKLMVFGFILFILSACYPNQVDLNEAGNSQSTIIPTTTSVPVVPTPSLDEAMPVPTDTQPLQPTITMQKTPFPEVNLQDLTGLLVFRGDIYNSQIFMMNLPCSLIEGTCTLTEIAWRGDINDEPEISQDGNKMVFVSDHNLGYGHMNIFVYEFASGEFLQLTYSDEAEQNPTWSPDGEMIAYAARTDDYSKVRIIHQDGCCRIDIDQPDGWNDTPSWSPNGTKLIFSSHERDSFDATLYLYDIETGVSTRISESEEVQGGSAAWSSDGQWIVFVTSENDENSLCTLNINSEEILCFSRPEQHIVNLAMKPKENYYTFVSRYVTSPAISDIFIGSVEESGVTQLTDSQSSNRGITGSKWAPNGQFIIYDAFTNGDPQPYLLVVEDGYPSIQLANTDYWLFVEDVWTP